MTSTNGIVSDVMIEAMIDYMMTNVLSNTYNVNNMRHILSIAHIHNISISINVAKQIIVGFDYDDAEQVNRVRIKMIILEDMVRQLRAVIQSVHESTGSILPWVTNPS